jgi:acyl-CoA synthetase (AMP-forming)/AMP-acid ligase II/4-hydroxybenzoate polyprenyltransferase
MPLSESESACEHNVATLLANVAQTMPDKTAIVLPKRLGVPPITFGQLWEQSSRLAMALQQRGLKLGDRVIVMVPMSIDLYVVMLALIRSGAVAVFVDPWMPLRRIAQFSKFAQPIGFIGIPKSHLIRLFEKSLRILPLTVTTGKNWGHWTARHTLQTLISESANDFEVAPVKPSDPALITFTSGSSGEPKGANRTHQFLAAQHHALAEQFPYRNDDIDLPMFPVFALNNLVSGIPSIVPDMDFRNVAGVDGKTIYQQMLNHGVTTCTVSPPLLDRLAETDKTPDLSLRRILTGGAPISDEQLKRWQMAYPRAEIIVAYGSTEAEPVAHIDSHERLALPHPQRGYCMGKPIERVATRVLPISKVPVEDSNWEDHCLNQSEIGELLVSGDHVCRDYFQNPQATRENKLVDRNGRLWHRMGDTGYFDETGKFWLVGRVHSTINRDGTPIHPQLVEQVVKQQFPKITQVAAIGVPDKVLGESLGVVAVAGGADKPTPVQLRQALQQANIPYDRCIISSEKLPVDPRHNSKIDYDLTRQKYFSPTVGSSELTAKSPFWSRLAAYSRERFPVLKHGILIASFYSSNHFLAQILEQPGRVLTYDLGSILGVLSLFLLFFHLRVFDEHKDFAEDSVHYPHRVLQRGIISLRELRWLGGAAILMQLLMAALWRPMPQPGALIAVLAALGFSILMLREFFVPKFLKRHFLLYATSHLMIMPLLAMIVFSYTTGDYFWRAPGWFWLYACVGFFVTFNWEISRKIRAPEQEIDGVDSYTRLLGVTGAAWWVLAMRLVDTALVMLVGWYLQASVWFYLALVGLFLGCLVGFVQYLKHQTPQTAGRMETWAGLYIIAFDLILAIELVSRYGLKLELFPQ